ncbi:MAG TPA: XdhC family protein [Myxococcales bacterium]|nr:XdhC family protein [Myxococcales bacterium]
MKHWHETKAILDRVANLTGEGVPSIIATVIHIAGSAYRRPGAKLLVEQTGATCGGISGGCLESDVRAQALEMLKGASGRLLHYDTGSDEETLWGMGLGCEGAVDIYLQRVDEQVLKLRHHLAQGQPFAAVTVIDGPNAGWQAIFARGALDGSTGDAELDQKIVQRTAALLEGNGDSQIFEVTPHRVFIDLLRTPPRLMIFGAGDDARPLCTLAAQAGFDVMVVDHRPAYLTAERFPEAVQLVLRRPEAGVEGLGLSRNHFAVVQTHALQHDRAWVSALAAKQLAYLGLLGPRGRKEQVMRDLALDENALFAPVGLDLGADGPEQVAISIVAEMLAVHAHREPRHLRARAGGIHAA